MTAISTDLVVDTSALIAILAAEAECERFAGRIVDAAAPSMSAANFLECGMVMSSRSGERGLSMLDRLMGRLVVDISAVDAQQARVALDAHLRFGRGRHPAKLNYGDCFAYALAKTTNAPLLFKGDDFAHTDLVAAL